MEQRRGSHAMSALGQKRTNHPGQNPALSAIVRERTSAGLEFHSPQQVDRWTWHRPVRAEHTTIAGFWFKPFATSLAVIEKLASIDWHPLDRLVPTLRAGNRRGFNHSTLVIMSAVTPIADKLGYGLIVRLLCPCDVCFTPPQSGHSLAVHLCPLWPIADIPPFIRSPRRQALRLAR
jgi:hypothetical protein